MGNPTNFVATVGIEVPEVQLQAASDKIKATLKAAIDGIDLKAFKDLAESAKLLAENSSKAAIEGVKLQKAFEGLAQAEEKTAQAKERTRLVTEQVNQQIEKGVKLTQQQTTVTDSLATAFQKILGGASPGSALSAPYQQLTQALAGVASGGDAAKVGLAALGAEGTAAVSGLTAGAAGLAAGLLALAPIALDLGVKLAAAFGAAYEQQKQFVFDSGIVAKQLGTTVQEGAKLRSLLTLIGQENNIFATITLNQIQASLASLDRVEKGLEKPTQLVTKFGDTLKGLGVDFRDSQGNVKNFLDVVVELSAALGQLPASQRSLAVQNLAGLFGTDVAKLFGFSPEELTQVMGAAVKVTDELSQANDSLRVSIVGLSSAQTEFNIALAGGVTPLETYFNYVKSGALKEGADILKDFFSRFGGIELSGPEAQKSGEAVGTSFVAGIQAALTGAARGAGGNSLALDFLNSIFPTPDILQQRANELKQSIAALREASAAEPGNLALAEELKAYEKALADVEKRLDSIRPKFKGISGVIVEEAAPSTAALTEHYKELDKALNDVEKAEKAVADAQKDIIKNNEEVAKSFSAQIDALQKTGEAYDNFYEKIGGIGEKIGALEAKQGKPFSFVGTGTVKDVEKALVDLRVLEERQAKQAEKGLGIGDPKFDQLALNIERRRKALGLQPGELTAVENIDITVGVTGLSAKDRKELNELFQQLNELRTEFLKGGFDVAQESFDALLGSLTNLSQADFATLLAGGATTLQKFAESVGLFSSPGFSQAIGEAALQVKLLAGGFGDLSTAAGAELAFQNYSKSLGDFRKDLFDLSDYISGAKKITIPLALEFGIVSQADLDLASFDPGTMNVGSIADAIEEQAQATAAQAAKQKVGGLGTGKGLVDLLLAKYGITTGEAIEATAKFTLDAKVDTSLAEKKANAEAEKLKAEENARQINVTWKLNVNLELGTVSASQQIQDILKNNGAPVQPPPPDGNHPRPGSGRAAGGPVFKGYAYPVNEEGKPEMFVPGTDGRILPGNQTADILRGLGSRERLPSQAVINYAPVVQQTLNVDARGTNAREVTQAIQRAQAKNMFVSSAEFVRSRDAVRARGLRY